MFRRLGYFARETLISLRRNLLMTLAGIMTVAVSLSLLGGALLIYRTVENGAERWRGGVEMEVFLNINVTTAQTTALTEKLQDDERVKKFRFLTEEDAIEEFKRIFSDNPDLTSTVQVGDLPASFRVIPFDAAATQRIADAFKVEPGVDGVVTAQEQIKSVLRGTRVVNLVLLSMAGVLLLAAVFLIVNTIRLATFARRREIEVMKLVGASNWFVRVPFMAEGTVQGLLGASIAFGAVYLLQQRLNPLLTNSKNLLGTFSISAPEAVSIGLWVLLIGVVIGLIGSVLGLRRFLDV